MLSSVILYLSIFMLVVMFAKVCIFLSLSSRHHQKYRRHHPSPAQLQYMPLVSVIVPCYNEELTAENCLTSLLDQDYPNMEIILVDDGSSDRTAEVIRDLALRHAAAPDSRVKVGAWSKPNGGKATALNGGIRVAQGEIVVCMDADSMFLPNTVTQLVLSFQEPDVMAVGGNVRVANRKHPMGRHQAIEYITGLTLQRRAFAHIGCMQVISGAIGAFRRTAIMRIGGYSTDTIVEDMDITIELARNGMRTVYNPYAIAYTEAPESVRDFLTQRYRWTYGGFQIIAKHKDLLFKRHHNKMGTIGMPYFAIFPWVDVAVSALLFITLARVIVVGDGLGLLIFYVFMCTLQASLMLYALHIDKEDKRLALIAAVDTLFYSHLISYTILKAGVNYLRKKQTGWNKLQRLGKNDLATVAATAG